MSVRSVFLSTAAVCALTAVATPASAWEPDTHKSMVGGEFRPWHSGLGTTFPLVVFADIGVTNTFFIDIYAPLTFSVNSAPNDRVRAGIGNPNVAFRYAPHQGRWYWYIGGGFGAPVNSIDDNDWALATYYAAYAHGLYDMNLWERNRLPIWPTGGFSVRVVEFLHIQADFKGINYVRVRNPSDAIYADPGNGFDIALQTRAGVELRHEKSGVGGGVHYKGVFVPTGDFDNAQTDIEAFFGFTGSSFFVRWGVLFALDDPAGPPFGDDPGDPSVFSQRGTIGGSW